MDLSLIFTESTLYLLFAVTALLSSVTAWAFTYFWALRRYSELREENTKLRTTLELERQNALEKRADTHTMQKQLRDTFSMLSTRALQQNNEQFLNLANENLKQLHIQSQSDLTQKEQAIKNMLDPIREALNKTDQQIQRVEKDRKEAYGSLNQYLDSMQQTQKMLHAETHNLSQAMRRPEVRGQWGELTLKRLAELSGMVEYCDFYEQEHTATSEGAFRPDMIIRVPGSREIIVDVKTPLDAYLSAIEATEDQTRNKYLAKHARNINQRVNELASKNYWKQFKHSPDFVVLFIPGDPFLSAALEFDRDLLEKALAKKVVPATPTSFVALLRTIAYGWRQQTLADNAETIRYLGEDLYKRLAIFSEHLGKVGKNLENTVENYNKAIGSFERQITPAAQKFTKLGISASKKVEQPDCIEKSVRSVAGSSERDHHSAPISKL